MGQCTIACDLHDYLEIACMYHYQLKCMLKDGEILEGTAIDTITQDKREYLLIGGGDNDERQQIELMQLKKLKVLTANAKFKEVIF